jgi:hypothetical protein
MTTLRTIAIAAALLLPAAAFAQSEEQRGSTPPGTSRDGAAPSDGALKGGAILPGEQGGVPTTKVPSRCDELEGTLRAECLEKERNAGAGGSADPLPSREIPPSPTPTAPPQNPRPR